MEEQSETLSSKKEFAFASSTILSQVGRGIIVGLVVGLIVGSFRFLIEKGFHLIRRLPLRKLGLIMLGSTNTLKRLRADGLMLMSSSLCHHAWVS